MGKAWSASEVDELRRLYPTERTQRVAEIMGRSIASIQMQAFDLGLSKVVRHERFVQGMTPWNKGTSYQAGGRSTETRFKKGSRTGAALHNYRPIGSLLLNKEGSLMRKVSETGQRRKDWRSVASIVWESAHGPIPEGCIVVFRKGMKTIVEAEVTLDRLECITRAENAHRNHPRNHDPELGRLVQLKGAINRQVNRIAREAKEKAA